MKKIILLPTLMLAILSLNSCKKNSHERDTFADSELIAHSGDQAFVSGEMDAFTTDLNVPLEASLSGRGWDNEICSATLAFDTAGSVKRVTITYNGPDCSGYTTRIGSVTLSIPAGTLWKNAGAQATVTYQDIHVTRIADNRSVTINGTHTLTNVNGGLLFQLLTGLPSITHAVSSDNMSITFDDGSQRQWHVARQRVYTLANGGTISITGTHQEGAQDKIAEWGTDRFGQSFSSSTPEPLVISANCQFRLISGQIRHMRAQGTATVTFGLDAAGNPVSCPAGNYFYKLTWTGVGGASLQVVAPY